MYFVCCELMYFGLVLEFSVVFCLVSLFSDLGKEVNVGPVPALTEGTKTEIYALQTLPMKYV